MIDLDINNNFVCDLSQRDGRELRQWLGVKMSQRQKIIGGTYTNMMRLKSFVPLSEWTEQARARAGMLEHSYRTLLDSDITRESLHVMGGELSVAQSYGVHWLLTTKSGILADIMGSGKTVQSCAAMQKLQPNKVLIICPLSVVHVWERHIAQWTDLPLPVVWCSSKDVFDFEQAVNNNVPVIIPWSSLRYASTPTYWAGVKRKFKSTPATTILSDVNFDLVIADEAHRAKDPAALQTRCFFGINSEYKWLLTGTPIANKPMDLWSLLRIVDPLSWSSKQKFIDEWCQISHNAFGGIEVHGFKPEKRELFAELTAHKVLRRSIEEVTSLRIAKNESQLFVDTLPAQRNAIDTLKKEWQYSDSLSGKRIDALNALMRLSMLFEIAQATPQIDDDNTISLHLPSPKITAVLDFIKHYDGQVVVFSRSRKLARLAKQAFEKAKLTVSYMDGTLTQSARIAAMDEFKAGQTEIFLATTKTASEGIDLSNAQVMLNLSGTWSLIDTLQATHRLIRPGQLSDEVSIVDVITEDSVDERIYDVINAKKHLVNSINWQSVYEQEMNK